MFHKLRIALSPISSDGTINKFIITKRHNYDVTPREAGLPCTSIRCVYTHVCDWIYEKIETSVLPYAPYMNDGYPWGRPVSMSPWYYIGYDTEMIRFIHKDFDKFIHIYAAYKPHYGKIIHTYQIEKFEPFGDLYLMFDCYDEGYQVSITDDKYMINMYTPPSTLKIL